MAGNVHRTMRGVGVDLDQLILANEKVTAVGNMRVNARGDEIGPGGEIIKSHSERVKEANALHSMTPEDIPVSTGTAALQADATPEERVVIEQETKSKRAPRKKRVARKTS